MTIDSGANPADPGRRRRIVERILIARAIVVMTLGVLLLTTGHGRPILGNLLAMYWFIGSAITLIWARNHRGLPGSRLALVSGIVGLAASAVALARMPLTEFVEAGRVLTLLGISAILMGLLRVSGSLRDDPRLPRRSWRRVVLGLGEIALGVFWITADGVDGAVVTSAGLWGTFGGAIMLLDALELHRTPRASLTASA